MVDDYTTPRFRLLACLVLGFASAAGFIGFLSVINLILGEKFGKLTHACVRPSVCRRSGWPAG